MLILLLILKVLLVKGFSLTENCSTVGVGSSSLTCVVDGMQIDSTVLNEVSPADQLSFLIFFNSTFKQSSNILWQLPNLKQVKIVNSTLESFDGNFFKNAGRLNEITITETFIPILFNRTFQHCKSVHLLTLSYDKIKSLEAAAFEGLEKLSELSLDYNQIEHLPDEIFNSLKVLVSISLRENKLKKISKSQFNVIFVVNTLDLAFNQITEVENGSLDDFVSINLSDNQMNEFEIPEFLVELRINRNNLTRFSCPTELNHLKYFEASNNSFSDWKCVEKMNNLIGLNLSYNPFLIPKAEYFQNLTNLESLDFFNDIPEHSINPYCGLKNVKFLKVNELISYEDLKLAVPNLRLLNVPISTWNCSYLKSVSCLLGFDEIKLSEPIHNCPDVREAFRDRPYFESDINEDLRKSPPEGFLKLYVRN